jgi:hypothetical protein
MGSSVLDGRPTPAAEIGRFQECWLLVACTKCGHAGRLGIARMIRRHRLPISLPIYKLEARLRCLSCDSAGRIRGVEGWRR